MRPWMAAALAMVGCGGNDSADIDSAPPTWYQEVGPLVTDRCVSCHRSDGIGGFSLETYADAQPWADEMVDAVASGRMPPWAATDSDDCTPKHGFKDDPRLSVDELDTLRAWAEADAPAGEEAEIPAAVIPTLSDPSIEVALNEPFVVDGDRDIYQCFRVEVPHDGDVWITDMEVVAGNDKIVHHVLVWHDPQDLSASKVGPDGSYACSGQPDVFPTDLIGGWTPGSPPVTTPENTGILFKEGGTIVINVHYHPTGDTSETDQTRVKLKWTDEQPANHATYFMVDLPFGARVTDGPSDNGGAEFRIPAGKATHRETIELDPGGLLPFDVPIFAIMPHMHYRGTDMRVKIVREGDILEDECVINAEGFRFDFQNNYVFDAPVDQLPVLRQNEKVEVRCIYNNDWSNPFIEEALSAAGETDLVDVYWGEETSDEMCMAVVGLVLPPIDLWSYF